MRFQGAIAIPLTKHGIVKSPHPVCCCRILGLERYSMENAHIEVAQISKAKRRVIFDNVPFRVVCITEKCQRYENGHLAAAGFDKTQLMPDRQGCKDQNLPPGINRAPQIFSHGDFRNCAAVLRLAEFIRLTAAFGYICSTPGTEHVLPATVALRNQQILSCWPVRQPEFPLRPAIINRFCR